MLYETHVKYFFNKE